MKDSNDRKHRMNTQLPLLLARAAILLALLVNVALFFYLRFSSARVAAQSYDLWIDVMFGALQGFLFSAPILGMACAYEEAFRRRGAAKATNEPPITSPTVS